MWPTKIRDVFSSALLADENNRILLKKIAAYNMAHIYATFSADLHESFAEEARSVPASLCLFSILLVSSLSLCPPVT
jgi:hypothetical protein